MSLPIKVDSKNGNNAKAIKYLEDRGVESRPLIAGNILKHPVTKMFNLNSSNDKLPGADFHHENSFYVGLSPEHSEADIERLYLVMRDLDKLLDY